MRKITLAVTLLATAGMLFAQSTLPTQNTPPRVYTKESVQNVTQTCANTQAIYGVVVGSQTPVVAVDGQKVPWKTASVQNMDATANLYWSYQATVSSIAAVSLTMTTATVGVRIAPAQIVTFALLPGVSYYMLNDSANKNVNAVVVPCQ